MLRSTTGLINAQAQGYGLRDLLRDGRFYVYSGGQPTDPDAAPTGTLGIIFTRNGDAYTPPVRSAGTVTLAGTAGSVASVKVGGMAYNLLAAAVPFNGTLGQTATDLAAAINARENPLNIVAEAAGAVVTLYAPFWLGAEADGLTVATTVSAEIGDDLTATPVTFAGGTTAVNGLNLDFPAVDGVLSRSEAWLGLGLADITAGWFRFVAGGSSVDGAGVSNIRFDGTLATSGGDLQVGSLTIKTGAMQTFGELELAIPASE